MIGGAPFPVTNRSPDEAIAVLATAISQLTTVVTNLVPRVDAIEGTVYRGGKSSVSRIGKSFPIVIKMIDGRNMAFDVRTTDRIEHVKRRIRVMGGPPPDEQRILYQGHQCEDDESIEDTGLTAWSSIYVCLRLRG
jgi:hypothetical protein